MTTGFPAPRLTLEQIDALIDEHKLGSFSRAIQGALVPSVRALVVSGSADEVGVSRLGGTPDVPPGFVWPTFQGRPLAFIAQLNCAELAPVEFTGNLPRRGLLSFFYEGEFRCWNTGDADHDAAKVIYTSASHALHRVNSPSALGRELRFSPCRLAFGAEFTLPAVLDALVKDREETDAEFEAWEALRLSLAAPNGERQPSHRIGGFMDAVQDFVQSNQDDLLFQVDSDDRAGMMWGDAGLLYWLIDRKELLRGNFDAAWIEGQCS